MFIVLPAGKDSITRIGSFAHLTQYRRMTNGPIEMLSLIQRAALRRAAENWHSSSSARFPQ